MIIVGGGDGNIENAYKTACILLHHMNVKAIAPIVFSHDTNNTPAINDTKAKEGARNLATFLNNKI